MEISASSFGICLDISKYITNSHCHNPVTFSGLVISASAMLPMDSSTSRTAVRSDPYRPPSTAPRAPVHRMRRIQRRSVTEDGGEDGSFGDGNGDDGPFGGGGGGKGWGSWQSGGSEWEEPDRRPWISSSADPAFDVIYEVLCWIALSNCAQFAFKKMSRLLAERENATLLSLESRN